MVNKEIIIISNIQEQLIDLEIINPEAISLLFPRVQDNEYIQVMHFKDSGVIFLNSSKHISREYYTSKKGYKYWAEKREESLMQQAHDNKRRLNDFMIEIKGKTWMEVGGGVGGMIDLAENIYKEVIFVEPQPEPRKFFKDKDVLTFPFVFDVDRNDIEVATLISFIRTF